MDEFSAYSNTLGFFIGNELVNETPASTGTAPFLKAAISDLKKYRESKEYRQVPIGSSLADVVPKRKLTQDYLVCRSTYQGVVDFVGLHSYSWCGDSSLVAAGWDNILDEAREYTQPVFFSEVSNIILHPKLC
jgi:hypothetical protein